MNIKMSSLMDAAPLCYDDGDPSEDEDSVCLVCHRRKKTSIKSCQTPRRTDVNTQQMLQIGKQISPSLTCKNYEKI